MSPFQLPVVGTAMPFDLQPIDILLLVILALAALSGWRRGFAMVLLGYLGLLIGLALGAWAATQAGLLVSADSSVRRLLTAVVVFFLVAAACHAVGNLLGIRARSLLGGRWTSRADAVGGGGGGDGGRGRGHVVRRPDPEQ